MNEYDNELNDLRLRAISKGINILDCFNNKDEIKRRIFIHDIKKILEIYKKNKEKKLKEKRYSDEDEDNCNTKKKVRRNR